jgi:hypothetical protein
VAFEADSPALALMIVNKICRCCTVCGALRAFPVWLIPWRGSDDSEFANCWQ